MSHRGVASSRNKCLCSGREYQPAQEARFARPNIDPGQSAAGRIQVDGIAIHADEFTSIRRKFASETETRFDQPNIVALIMVASAGEDRLGLLCPLRWHQPMTALTHPGR